MRSGWVMQRAGRLMGRCSRRLSQRGQSILEYLIVAVAIIGAILVFAPNIATSIGGIGATAQGELDNANTVMGTTVAVTRQ